MTSARLARIAAVLAAAVLWEVPPCLETSGCSARGYSSLGCQKLAAWFAAAQPPPGGYGGIQPDVTSVLGA